MVIGIIKTNNSAEYIAYFIIILKHIYYRSVSQSIPQIPLLHEQYATANISCTFAHPLLPTPALAAPQSAEQTTGLDSRECAACVTRYALAIFSTLREEIDIKERPAGNGGRRSPGRGERVKGGGGGRGIKRRREIEIAEPRGSKLQR